MRTYHELNLPARTEYSGRGGGRRCMWRAGPPGGLHLQRNPTVRTVAQLRGWFQRETIRRPASGAARHTRFAFSTHRARKQMNSTRNTTVPNGFRWYFGIRDHPASRVLGYLHGWQRNRAWRSTGGRSLGRTERRRGRAGGCAAAYVMLVGSGQVWRLITVVITS
jgi:hypothetical protein